MVFSILPKNKGNELRIVSWFLSTYNIFELKARFPQKAIKNESAKDIIQKDGFADEYRLEDNKRSGLQYGQGGHTS
jgi:hypothetical protein